MEHGDVRKKLDKIDMEMAADFRKEERFRRKEELYYVIDEKQLTSDLTEKGRSIPGGNCVPPFWAAVGKGEVEWEENLIEKFSPWLVNCHLHDNDGYDDRHWMPGKGNIDWKRIMSVLARSPRLRSIQSEVRVEGCNAARADELRNVFDSLVTAYFRAEAE